MLFNSLTFFAYFIVVFGIYWTLPSHRARLGVLLVASWLFYAAWHPAYLILLLASSFGNHYLGLLVGKYRETKPVLARRLVTATIVLNILPLMFYKYLDFAVTSLCGIASWTLGASLMPPHLALFLPLGISFYTFEMVAYIVDIHRGECEPIRNPLKTSLFDTFFPRLIAGPIVRRNEFAPQLDSKRQFNGDQFLRGLDLIFIGLFKKVFIADQLAPFVDKVFDQPTGVGSGALLLGVYAYAVQIYCDFSGYTDIGRGCAACLGYELPINFSFPYFSCNIADFWRRWHITLSSWLRDYLYIPLGGNRLGEVKTYRNLLLTMLLGGLWHGASWCFVFWGVLHGAGLAVNRLVHQRRGLSAHEPLFAHPLYRLAAIICTFHFVCFGWIFFRADSFAKAFTVVRGIASLRLLGASDLTLFGATQLGVVAAALAMLLAVHNLIQAARRRGLQLHWAWQTARPLVFASILAMVFLVAGRHPASFIYFQF